MGVRILSCQDGAVLIDSVTDTPLSVLLEDLEEAESFIEWLSLDARKYDSWGLKNELVKFREHREKEIKK